MRSFFCLIKHAEIKIAEKNAMCGQSRNFRLLKNIFLNFENYKFELNFRNFILRVEMSAHGIAKKHLF